MLTFQNFRVCLLCLFSIQVEELRSRLTEEEKQTMDTSGPTMPAKCVLSDEINGSSPALPEKPLHSIEVRKHENTGTQMSDTVPATGVIVCF